MGVGVPLLNEYKQEFLYKRLPQTIFGGPKLRLGYDAPAYVYLNQILLWTLPWLLGGIFTLVLELAFTSSEVDEHLLLYCCLYGACIVIFVVVVQTISTVVQMKEKENTKAISKKNILAEEDEVDFNGCCGAETIEFVIPPKYFKLNILIHGLISGAMCGIALWYLLPSSLNSLYGDNYGATAILFIFGWLTLSIAQYSLTATAPPEPAIFRTMDVYELSALTRPFYVLGCLAFHILHHYWPLFEGANKGLHIVFACLPILWVMGLVPPLEDLFLWLAEQAHIFLFGGSPMASNLRLLLMLIASVGVFLGAYYIPAYFGTILLSASMGYLLSCDLGSLGKQVLQSCQTKNKVSTSQFLQDSKTLKHNSGFLWSWCTWTFLYHFVVLGIVTGLAAVVNLKSCILDRNVCGWTVVGLCITEKITRDLQGVFIILGLVRNYFFPHTVQTARVYLSAKKRLFPLGLLRRLIINWVGPLAMVVYMSLVPKSKTDPCTNDVMCISFTQAMSESYPYLSVWYTFGIIRAFRWVWQSTAHALLELSVVHIIITCIPCKSNVTVLEAPILLLITSLVRDRLYQLSNKLYFFITLLITSWRDKKQRRRSSALICLLSIIFFPIVLAVLVVGAVLSAPLLPIFTLPIFFVAFPRLYRFWPESVGASVNACADTVYYRQFAPMFARALRIGFSNGSLGEPNVGNHYLVRFQDRLAWLMVLERGSAYCSVSIKGLELQETSCHTAEAARLDDIFEVSFENESGFSFCSFNQYPLHSLTPVDACTVQTYSDARNVLTGVIDSPNGAEITLDFFVKSLVWVVLHHVNTIKRKEEEEKKWKDQQQPKTEKQFAKKPSLAVRVDKKGIKKSKIENKVSEINHNHHTSNFNTKGNYPGTLAPINLPPPTLPPLVPRGSMVTGLHHGGGDNLIKSSSGLPAVEEARPPSGDKARKNSWSSSINSFSDSLWSDDDLDKPKSKKKSLKQAKVGHSLSQPMNSAVTSVTPKFYSNAQEKTDLEDFLNDLDFGLPVSDVNRPKTMAPGTVLLSNPLHSSSRMNGNHIYKPVTNLAGSPDFKCQFSSHMSLPSKWRELPIENSQLARHMGSFPVDWYRYVLAQLDWSMTGLPSEKVAIDVGADDALTNCYSQLIMACCSAFDMPDKRSGPSYLYKSYIGDVPWNAMMDWLSEDKELYGLVIKAFRYGFKLMLDSSLLGVINGHEELEESLQDFDKNWYIGRETDPEWKAAVLDNRPNLFSLGHNNIQGTYTSRVLSMQELMVNVGRLNAEVVRGQWANLSLELLYMTNDDEERYSIQAHPAILRNLTVQAADPPLGYPIFSSEPISVPTL